MVRFDVVTLFPECFSAITENGITSRARRRGLWDIHFWNPRDVTEDLHRTVDDRPFGGGPGMVMMAEPLARTLELVRLSGNAGRVIAFAPSGVRLTDGRVRELSTSQEDLVLVCGRYEGIDQRFLDEYVDETVSLGDFVLSGAELPACCLLDAVIRQLPGAIKEASTAEESFAEGLLEAPHYTRPEVWRGQRVPEVLLSGHHANIAKWTRERQIEATWKKRPELIRIARSLGLLTKTDEQCLRRLAGAGLRGREERSQ